MIELMPKGTNKEELSQVLEILSQIHSPENSEEDITEQDQVTMLSRVKS